MPRASAHRPTAPRPAKVRIPHNKGKKRTDQTPLVVPLERIADAHDSLISKHPHVTPQQAQLVEAMLHTGGSIGAVAKRMGYDKSWAYETMRKEHVARYRHDLALMTVGWDAIAGLNAMRGLLNSPSHYVRYSAAADLMDRAGLRAAPEPSNHGGAVAHVNINLSQAQPVVHHVVVEQQRAQPNEGPLGSTSDAEGPFENEGSPQGRGVAPTR